MKFELKATIEKQVWTNGESYLYGVTDQETERAKQWSIFTKEAVEIGATYLVTGTVSEGKDKKVKDANGRDIWRTNFNAESVKLISADAKESLEPDFSSSEEIPF